MISFIVIGKNEGWRLSKCLTSITTVVQEDRITDYEILYVDSKSTDDSILRASAVKGVRIFEITGACNAAIARNIGAQEAKGDILFFIDGDMEIQIGFIPKVLNSDDKLVYPFVSGIFEDYIYNKEWNFIEIQRRYSLTEYMPDRFEFTTGGLFLITKTLWFEVGGMDNRLVRSQDIDLGLRLAQKGVPLLRKSKVLAHHHTIAYLDGTRKDIYSKSALYTALLVRKHLFNIKYLPTLIKTQYTIIGFVISILWGWIFQSFLFVFLYVLLLVIKALKFHRKSSQSFFASAWIVLVRDMVFLKSFLVSYPANAILEYHQIR